MAVHPLRNLCWLALDYVTAILVIAATISFWSFSAGWGLHWIANLVVGFFAIILLGGVQHRLGLMGHEASHNMIHPNGILNDLIAEWFCFFPVFGTLTQYRAKHLSHHLHTNVPDKDPNLAGTRAKKLYDRFPMPRPSFIYNYYLKFFWPPFVLYNLLDLFRVITIGSGLSPIPEEGETSSDTKERKPKHFYQNATLFGIGYLCLFLVALRVGERFDSIPLFFAVAGGTYLVGLVGWLLLPEDWVRRPGGRLAYSPKLSALLRLTYYTLLFGTLAFVKVTTGIWAGGYFLLLWISALVYVFPYFMLLREIYQHANTDEGEITNSRIIYADPFTHWALLGYGNDLHLVHHIYPNIPHYRLRRAHSQLMEECPVYRDQAEEAYGTFSGGAGRQSLLDTLVREPRERGEEAAMPQLPPHAPHSGRTA